jgi:hypothetical protein
VEIEGDRTVDINSIKPIIDNRLKNINTLSPALKYKLLSETRELSNKVINITNRVYSLFYEKDLYNISIIDLDDRVYLILTFARNSWDKHVKIASNVGMVSFGYNDIGNLNDFRYEFKRLLVDKVDLDDDFIDNSIVITI